MKKISTTLALVILITGTAIAQQTVELKPISRGEVFPIDVAEKEDRKPAIVVQKKELKQVSFAKPATKTGTPPKIDNINYNIDSKKSDLDNLIELKELKQNINLFGDERLKSTSEYQNLNQDINSLRAKFDKHVNTVGIKNCSDRERSYFLAFLKEDGLDTEYQKYIQQLKN